MRHFVLKMQAYHFLERNHYVCINESGDYMNNRNSRVRYFIFLDEEKKVWVYQKFTKEKNEFNEYIKDPKISYCIVHAGFDQLSKFNYG